MYRMLVYIEYSKRKLKIYLRKCIAFFPFYLGNSFYPSSFRRTDYAPCKGEANFISSGSKIVKRLRCASMTQRSCIERTIGLCLAPLQPCTDHSLSVALWLTRRLGLNDGPCLNLLRATESWSPFPLVVSPDSVSLWTWARVQTARSTTYFNGCPFLLRSADEVGRPFCCCIVFSFLLFLFYYFYFISFPLSAFCDFSAIFHRISLIFGQLVDNNL